MVPSLTYFFNKNILATALHLYIPEDKSAKKLTFECYLWKDFCMLQMIFWAGLERV